ncbi:13347_t:CDS:2 [Funneliformis geosporum]|uniref:13347_t:CDS:1 n=1 Tax=Funneliformis geosporum TaxID=1117311 RepID=A0A9W4SQV0_9GLOM|nr:13347_t:CDS:2 [Funneliformis geosporum]
MEHFVNTVISSEEFTIKTLGMEFLSIKDDNNNQTKHFDITVISSEEFTIKALGMEFLFIKGDNNNLIIFKDEEREIDGK